MNKFFRKTKGAISIFLVLIMLPMFTSAGLIVDGARISAARTSVTGAGDLAMNAALSEYHEVLLDVYGLFAMSETTEELEKNVSRYFSNTINNEGILQGSDSYTRSFINSIGSLFSTGDISFDNIVDTQVESFSLVEVSNSALANPTVLERQIIEYMKYRGPISLGTGLLTKLGCIGETSKQTKALEAKVNYEKKLDTVQDACEMAYNAINSFNSQMDGSKYTGDYLTALNNDLAKARILTKEMAEYIIAVESPSYKVSSLAENDELKSSVKREINNLSGENKKMQAYNLLKDKLKQNIEFEVAADGNYVAKETSYTRTVKDYFGYGPGSTIQSQTQYIVDVKSNMSIFTEMYTYLLMLDNYYDKLTDEEQESLSKENEAYATITAQLIMIVNGAKNASSTWKNSATVKGKAASELLYGWYSQISGIETKLTDAIEALDIVLEKAGELDLARTTWSNKVDDLSESEIKSSMESDYSNSARDMNETAINALKTVLQDNKTHFSKIKEKLDNVTFYGKKICISDYASINYFDRYASSIPEFEINASYNSLSTSAEGVMDNYVNADVKTGITPATYKKITEDQQFYKYLKNVCVTIEGETTEESIAKNNRTELINQGNADKSADVTGMMTGNYVTSSGLTSDISDAIESFAQGNDAGANSFDPTAIDSSGDDDSMADNGKSNLTEISNLLTNLADVVEIARDCVYIEEYFAEMFSCYTTGKGTEDLMTLSNKDMSTNKFFGSEMEYILYGKDSVQANLNCSKASIFGVRFALNSIYALTSSDTRTPALTAATAIAGWTGFGVPIVQTVILLAWSMAESMMDLNHLCNGEAVALYKSSDTWVLGINGAIQLGKDAANAVIDDVFTKIENTAMDSIDSITTTVNDYVGDTTRGLVDNIQGKIMTSIETLTVQIVGESKYDLTEKDVQIKVDGLLNSMLSSASSDRTSDKATRLAIEAIKTVSVTDPITGSSVTARDYLVSTIHSAYTDAKDGKLTDVSSSVKTMLDYVVNPIRDAITGAVSSVGDELKNEVSQIVSEGGDQVKEKVTSAIDNYLGNLGGTEGGGTAIATGFSLTYKEYVKAFMLLSIVANKTSMLQRCAELIQANVSQRDSSFNITKAYTMVEVNATVSIRTTFFDIPVTSGVDSDGNQTYDLDFSNIGSGRQEIKYVGILGY